MRQELLHRYLLLILLCLALQVVAELLNQELEAQVGPHPVKPVQPVQELVDRLEQMADQLEQMVGPGHLPVDYSLGLVGYLFYFTS